jgi:hypothetical protein
MGAPLEVTCAEIFAAGFWIERLTGPGQDSSAPMVPYRGAPSGS